MKNRRRIIIALVLVAVFAVGAVLYFTVLGPALEPEETVKVPIETQQGEAIDTTDRIQIFPRITAENVQSISVKNEHGSFEIYRDPNNDFRIKGHEHLSLRTTKVSELISIAGYPLARKKIDSSAQEYEQYGLNAPVAECKRMISTGPAWAYLLIAEGCDNWCAFCIIPKLRGKYRSRTMEHVLAEARQLADSGVKELIVIAQDITRWGMDLYGKPSLALLLRELAKINGIRWIRLHYLYPEIIDDELIDLIANEDKIVKYLDIPIQHIDNDILRRMNRHCTGDEIRALLQKLRARIPGLVLRTSLITGLPGEGEAEFEELCTWLREVRLERVGVFPFSPEEGTPAAVMTDRCEPDEAQRRADLILELQAGIMDDYNAACIGRDMTVLCEHRARSGMCSGRTYADSPEIDGTVYFTGAARPGDMVTVHITGCDDGDLAGEQIHE
mgnify:CR=1 FL=1